MHQQPDQRARHEFGTKSYNLHQAGSQGWRYGIGDNILSPNVLSRSTLSVASSNPLNFGGQMSEMLGSVRIQEHGGVASSIARPTMGEHLMQDTQRDQIGSSNSCTSYSYLEPHFRDGTLAHGRRELIYPAELHAVPHYGTTSPFVLSEEPVYVNAKQYHAILRRRQLRAKAEMENKLTRVRKPYLHESRHLHALRRARGCGGRFVNTKKSDTSTGNATHEEGNSISDSPRMTTFSSAPDSRYASTDSSGLVETSTSLDEFRRLSLQGTNHPEFFQWDSHKRFLSK